MANHEKTPAFGDAQEQMGEAEVAIRDDQFLGCRGVENAVEQGAFVGVGVEFAEQVGEQSGGVILFDDRHAGEGGGRGGAWPVEAAIGAGGGLRRCRVRCG